MLQLVAFLKAHVIYSSAGLGSVHPEMFDENGNVIPDEILQYDLKTIMTMTKRTTTKRKSTTTRKPVPKKIIDSEGSFTFIKSR